MRLAALQASRPGDALQHLGRAEQKPDELAVAINPSTPNGEHALGDRTPMHVHVHVHVHVQNIAPAGPGKHNKTRVSTR